MDNAIPQPRWRSEPLLSAPVVMVREHGFAKPGTTDTGGRWSSGEQLHHLFGYRTWLGGVRWCVSYSVAVHRQPQRYWRRWQRIQGYRRSMVGHDERYGSADTKG